jgi:hypothetical protein
LSNGKPNEGNKKVGKFYLSDFGALVKTSKSLPFLRNNMISQEGRQAANPAPDCGVATGSRPEYQLSNWLDLLGLGWTFMNQPT